MGSLKQPIRFPSKRLLAAPGADPLWRLHVDEDLGRLKSALAGRYTVEREIGRGGMAVVYLADDLKHGRKVALKVLRPELAAAVGSDRFLQEIRITARLQHPHIVPLYDSGDVEGRVYFTMPYVEGETLRGRLDREGQLQVPEAISIGEAVASALEFAHQRGVLHRDIKPENILLHDGVPLVADFGIALAFDRAVAERMTETGLSLGTPVYMSPEQASGDRELDARSDVYSLACVVYEMLAGDPPFAGSSRPALLARVLNEQPAPVRMLRATVPPHVEEAIGRALAKVPADRYQDAASFARALREAAVTATPGPAASLVALLRSPLVRYGATAAAAVAAVWLFILPRGEGGTATATIRPLTSFIGWEHRPSWSPDGSMIAYTHVVNGSADVATLSVAGGDPHILTAGSPADEFNAQWSPDGSKIVYVSDRGRGTDLYWIAPTGGPEHRITSTYIPFLERLSAWSGSLGTNPWSPDGREVVFSRLEPSGDVALWKVNLETREETRLTDPPSGADDGEGSWSRDGRTLAFVRILKGHSSIFLLSLSDGGVAPVAGTEGGRTPAWYRDDRSLVFSSARAGPRNIWEIALRNGHLAQLTTGAGNDTGPSVSADGAIAFTQFQHEIDVYWAEIGAPDEAHQRLTSFTGDNFGARVSPDGGAVAYYSARSGDHDIWVLDRATGVHRNLTENPAADRLPDWSPEGTAIVFMSDRTGAVTPWILDPGTGATRQLTDHELPWSMHTAEGQTGPRWAPDGSVIAYLAPGPEGNVLWTIRPDGTDRKPSSLSGVLSFDWYRDGRRVIYTRNTRGEGGQLELRATNLATGEDVLLREGAIAEVAVSRSGHAVSFIDAVSHFTMDLSIQRLTAPDDALGGLPLLAGEETRVTHGQGVWHVHSGGWSPDGTALVYSRDRDWGDIYLLGTRR